MADGLSLVVAHRLPGRVRLELSHPLRDAARMKRAIVEHAGVDEVRYTAITQSVLLRFDPVQASAEEMIVRVALCLSLDYDSQSVRLLAAPEQHSVTNSAWYSALALSLACGARLFGPAQRSFDLLASFSTAGAVLAHAWQEVEDHGNFDPEVLSVVYLLAAIIKGHSVPAALFTWVTTFGRHLVQMPARAVELCPTTTASMPAIDGPIDETVEVVVRPDRTPRRPTDLLGLLPMLFKYLLTGEPPNDLLEALREASHVHGEVLEGLGDFRRGIPLRFRA